MANKIKMRNEVALGEFGDNLGVLSELSELRVAGRVWPMVLHIVSHVVRPGQWHTTALKEYDINLSIVASKSR